MRGINRILAAASVFVVAASIGAVASVGGVDGETTEKTTGRGMKAVAKENRYALIIGVDYFPNLPTKEANESVASDAAERPSDEYDLNCCVLDARRLADALVEHAGFATENVDVMTFQKGDELDPNDPTVPTAENIRRKIDALAGTLAADDMLLVAFSGHGVMLGVESNDDPEKRSYLCACDADLNRLSTFVDRKALLETLKQCRAERKLFIADCCRNFFELNEGARARGRAFGSRSTGAANPFETGNYGFAQISACREGQEALETEGVGGLFTSALIDGLRRGANAAGELSLTAWFEYAKAQTTKRSQAILASNPNLGAVDKKTGERQKEQEPTLYLLGETPGWIFADGLPVDGLPGETWAKADALFDEAVKIRGRLRAGTIRSTGDGAESARVAEWRSAQAKIAEALELTAEAGESSVRRAKYVAEETRLTKWAATEAEKLATDAWTAFELGDATNVEKAVTLMEESLALVDSVSNRRALTTFKKGRPATQGPTAEEKPESGPVAPPTQGRRLALLIGCGDYETLPDLEFSGADVEALKEWALENGFERENVVVLLDGDKNRVERELEAFCKLARPEDVVFAYFVGHDARIEGRDYFAPCDAKLNGDTLEGMVSLDDALDGLARSPAKHKFCLYDAARDENAELKLAADATISPADSEPAKNRGWTLYACGPGEYAFESKKAGGGLLTRAFLEGTTELGDADGDGVVTAMEACRYAMKKTSEDAKKLASTEQTPRLSVDGDDFALSLRPKKAEKKEKEENAAQGDGK